MLVEGSCHCGAVRIEISRAPAELTSCNCSICRRLGTLWAYYAPAEVRISGSTATYAWGGKNLEFHRCVTCGCATHWSPTDPPRERMGINLRMMEPAVVESARTA